MDEEFDRQVAATQIGVVIALDKRALQRWRLRRTVGQSRANPAALERQVMNFAAMHPQYVVFGPRDDA